jgi:hypothetical protein
MKKNKKKTAGRAGTQAQLPDSKGINPARDAGRRKGGAVVTVPHGGGSGTFRKARRASE